MGVTVADLMTREVFTISPDMTLTEMDRQLIARRLSGAPVVEGQTLVGVASRADAIRALLDEQEEAERVSAAYASPFLISLPSLERLAQASRRISEHMTKRRVRDVMTKEPKTVRPTDDVRTAARRMVADRIHRLPVVDDGRLVGIVSALDLARMIAERE
jgi:CBS domain-containing protein